MRPRRALNPRPPDYMSGALPSELPGPTSPLPAITCPGDCSTYLTFFQETNLSNIVECQSCKETDIPPDAAVFEVKHDENQNPKFKGDMILKMIPVLFSSDL